MTLLDAIYIPVAVASSPLWVFKKRGGWRGRFGHAEKLGAKVAGRPRVVLHAVSVGEVSALRSIVPELARSAEVVVSVTTDTGFARATDLFGSVPGVSAVVRYPLDLSWSVARFLDAVAPDVVGLVELEVWPQFVRACAARGVPVAVINGRLSERSFKGYRRLGGFFGRTLRLLACAGVQDDAYAARFVALGMDASRVRAMGTMKWDSATIADGVAGAEELAREMGIDRSRPLIVAGSTAEDEEALLHRACPPGAQLLCAPRKPEHFEDAARAMPGCVRRTAKRAGSSGGDRFLLDTIGELRKAYALADVVVMGRSFGSLYGSDPIEPVALGRATVIGRAVKDFEVVVGELVRGGGLVQVGRDGLAHTLQGLCADARAREELAARGRATIRAQQGASAKYAQLLLSLVRGESERGVSVGGSARS